MKHTFEEQEKLMRKSAAHSMQPLPVDELVLVRLLTNFTQLYKDHRTKLLRQFGFNETQFLALVLIYYQPKQAIQPSNLSEMLGSSRTNITRVSDELEKNGWIERKLMKEDRRAYLLKITTQGIEFLEKFLPNQWKLIHETFAVLSREEQGELLRILRKLTAHIEKVD